MEEETKYTKLALALNLPLWCLEHHLPIGWGQCDENCKGPHVSYYDGWTRVPGTMVAQVAIRKFAKQVEIALFERDIPIVLESCWGNGNGRWFAMIKNRHNQCLGGGYGNAQEDALVTAILDIQERALAIGLSVEKYMDALFECSTIYEVGDNNIWEPNT